MQRLLKRDIVELLLKEDADMESKNEDRMTTLQWAARNGHEALAQQVLKQRNRLNNTSFLPT